MLVCQNFLNLLSTEFQGHLVAVEFESGNLAKKAEGVLTCIGPDFLRLEAPSATSSVTVTIFFGTECPIVECAEATVIKTCRITSVELCPGFGTCPPTLFPTVCPTII